MNDQIFNIQGLGGGKTLKGEVKIGGAKNAVLPLFVSSLLFEDGVRLSNIPDIEDVHRMSELMRKIGVSITREGEGAYLLDASKAEGSSLDHEIAKRLRASIILIGPMLARFGKVITPHPGGCVIGERPIDIFITSFEKMGVVCKETDMGYEFSAPQGLRPGEIFLKFPSVTATETLIMAAVLTEGKTIIGNAAMEPEIVNLAEFLNNCGAEVKGVGTTTITIHGSKKLLRASQSTWGAIPDRIEAGSFLILGALCATDLLISNCNPSHLESIYMDLSSAGVPIEVGNDYLRIRNNNIENSAFKSFNVTTHVYPGFPTDLQAPVSVFLTQSSGEAMIFETIFENRLSYSQDLVAMGADILALDAHRIIIKGNGILKGKELYGPDLRAGLALTIAALVAEGESRIHNVYYIDRGYEHIDDKLRSIGAKIERI